MELETTPPVHDPELDGSRHRVEATAPWHDVHLPQEYQRLLANPFLAVTIFLIGLALIGIAFRERRLNLLIAAAVPLLGSLAFLQYHCLDCGATGSLYGWRGHACPRVVKRHANGRPRRLRGPNPTYQTILWFYGLIASVILGIVFFRLSY